MQRNILIVAALVVVLVTSASGCGVKPAADEQSATSSTGTSPAAMPVTTVTAPPAPATTAPAAGLPEGVTALLGVTAKTRPGPGVLWRKGPDGISTVDVVLDGGLYSDELAVGRSGSVIAYSDPLSGSICLWRPSAASLSEIHLDVPAGRRVVANRMALSPDESTLALVRVEGPEGDLSGFADLTIRGYLIDVESEQVKTWEALDSVRQGGDVYSFLWDRSSTAIYATFDSELTGWGDRSWRFDVAADAWAELTGLPTILDVGPRGEVLGYDPRPGGAVLVLWQDGESLLLPRDPEEVSWGALGWISDEGGTVVAWGWPAGAEQPRPCLAVLKLSEAGWEAACLYEPNGSMEIIAGIGFGPQSDVFWLEICPVFVEGGTYPTDVRLVGLDTGSGRVTASLALPERPGECSHVLAIVGALDGPEGR